MRFRAALVFVRRGITTTDANGHTQTPPLPTGRYWAFGDAKSTTKDVEQARSREGGPRRLSRSKTGVVDQDVDRNALLAKAPWQLDDCRNIREIDLLHHDIDAVLPA
jgi:hypothetical protein